MKVNSIPTTDSVPDPLHVLQEHLLTAAVIEFRGAAVGMASDPLHDF
jgi:hypothetical protein